MRAYFTRGVNSLWMYYLSSEHNAIDGEWVSAGTFQYSKQFTASNSACATQKSVRAVILAFFIFLWCTQGGEEKAEAGVLVRKWSQLIPLS